MPVRRLRSLVLLPLIAAGCAATMNTLAQDLAWERIEYCKNININVILDRVESDGRVWVSARNGTVGIAEWNACMDKAALEQASIGRPPLVPPTQVKPTVAINGAPPAPRWSVGEEWAFRWESPTGRGTYITSVVREERVDGLDCQVMKLGEDEFFYRKGDVAIVKETRNGAVRTANDPPRRLFDWPLTVGKTWSQSVTSAGRTTEWTWKVEAQETITLPAGAFETLRIAARTARSDQLIYEMWYAPEVKLWVKLREQLRPGVRERELIGFKLRRD